MAQIIKHRRGSINDVKSTTTRNGELLIASGSISDLSGPFVFIGSPVSSDEGVAGAFKPTSKIYSGTNAPTISATTYGSILDGIPFYASSNESLYILNNDGAGGNSLIDLTGNIEGNVISGVTINSLTGSLIDISSTLNVGGNTTLNGDLLINGNTFQTGNIDLTGNITLGGNITIGDEDTDFVKFGGEISSSIVPDVHNAFDLGSPEKNWRNLHVSGVAYVNELEAQSITLNGITVFDDLSVSGNTFLGSGGGDIVVVSGSIFNDSLTNNRVVIVGTQGLLEDDANFVFDGTELNIGVGNFTVQQSSGNVDASGTLNVDGNLTAPSLRGYNSLFGTASSEITTFIVTVSSKTSNHRYFGTGSGSGYFIDGIESPFLTLLPGKTYRFNQSDGSNGSHQILFYYDANRNTQYTTNVTTNGTAGSTGAYTEIVVTDTTPVVLHYQCVNHGYMGNAAQFNSNVVDTPYQVIARNGVNVNGSSVLNNTLEVKGTTSLNSTLTVTGSATLKDNLSVSGTTSVVGATTLQNTLQVNSTSELKGSVGINSTLDVTGSAQFKSTINVDSEATLASATIEDLTQDRIVTVGAGGSLIDSSGLTYNGSVLKIGDGQFEVDTTDGDIRTSGSLTSNGLINNGNVLVNGVLTVTGNTLLQSNLFISGNLEVLGGATSVLIQSQTVELDDNIILLNAYSPFERYAGIEVMDSGSTNLSASFLWDGLNDYWMFMSSSGQSSKLVGTTAGTYGSEVSLTPNKITKATGTSTIGDSLLDDDATTLTYNTNKFTVASSDGATLIAGNVTLSSAGGADGGINTSAVVFRNSSNVVGYVSTTETTDVLDGILGYKASDGALVFSTVIDGGTY